MNDENLKEPLEDLKESLENKLSQVHIPEPEEFIKKAAGISQVYGLLFGETCVLKYAVLNDEREIEKMYLIKDTNSSLRGLLAAEDDVYFQNDNYKICSLFGNFKSRARWNITESIVEHQGKIFDAGIYQLYETLTDKLLMTKKELSIKKIDYIASISAFQDKLYALCYKPKYAFTALEENNGKYKIGGTIIEYEKYLTFEFCQALILPGISSNINGKEYGFSVLSCVYLNYLDLNNQMIIGTDGLSLIHRCALLSSDSERAEVVYSGDFEGINFAEIDLNKKTAKTRKLITNSRALVSSLDVVRNKELHNKLINFGKELK